MKTITMIWELEPGSVQAWTFDIKEGDLSKIAEKYGTTGTSVLTDADGIADEIKEIWK